MNMPPPSTPLDYKPEWIRPSDAKKLFGISRTTIYEWIRAGKVKSRLIKKRGNVQGVRLVSYASLNDYISRHVETRGDDETTATGTESEELPTLPLWLLRGMITPEVLEIMKARLGLTPEKLALLIVRMISAEKDASQAK